MVKCRYVLVPDNIEHSFHWYKPMLLKNEDGEYVKIAGSDRIDYAMGDEYTERYIETTFNIFNTSSKEFQEYTERYPKHEHFSDGYGGFTLYWWVIPFDEEFEDKLNGPMMASISITKNESWKNLNNNRFITAGDARYSPESSLWVNSNYRNGISYSGYDNIAIIDYGTINGIKINEFNTYSLNIIGYHGIDFALWLYYFTQRVYYVEALDTCMTVTDYTRVSYSDTTASKENNIATIHVEHKKYTIDIKELIDFTIDFDALYYEILEHKGEEEAAKYGSYRQSYIKSFVYKTTGHRQWVEITLSTEDSSGTSADKIQLVTAYVDATTCEYLIPQVGVRTPYNHYVYTYDDLGSNLIIEPVTDDYVIKYYIITAPIMNIKYTQNYDYNFKIHPWQDYYIDEYGNTQEYLKETTGSRAGSHYKIIDDHFETMHGRVYSFKISEDKYNQIKNNYSIYYQEILQGNSPNIEYYQNGETNFNNKLKNITFNGKTCIIPIEDEPSSTDFGSYRYFDYGWESDNSEHKGNAEIIYDIYKAYIPHADINQGSQENTEYVPTNEDIYNSKYIDNLSGEEKDTNTAHKAVIIEANGEYLMYKETSNEAWNNRKGTVLYKVKDSYNTIKRSGKLQQHYKHEYIKAWNNDKPGVVQ